MPTELEAKFKVDSHAPIREALRAAGATYRSRVEERNDIFDLPGAALRRQGSAVRVRSQHPDDGSPPTHRLTFKGPVVASQFKRREEIEVETADGDATRAILLGSGFVIALSYEKRRESWQLGECSVELDELPVLGLFVEIEGPTEAAITAAQEKAGLQRHTHEPQGYVTLLATHCANHGIAERIVRFSDPE